MGIVLRAKDIMNKDIVSVEENESVLKAVEIMLSKNIGSVAVRRKGEIAGILTERDILSRVLAEKRDLEKTKVGEVMSSPLITVDADSSLYKISRKMIENNIRRIFVEENGKIVGLISQQDLVIEIMNAFLSLLAI